MRKTVKTHLKVSEKKTQNTTKKAQENKHNFILYDISYFLNQLVNAYIRTA